MTSHNQQRSVEFQPLPFLGRVYKTHLCQGVPWNEPEPQGAASRYDGCRPYISA